MKLTYQSLATLGLTIPNDSSTGPWYWDCWAPVNLGAFDAPGIGDLDINLLLFAYLVSPNPNVNSMGIMFLEAFFQANGAASVTYDKNTQPTPTVTAGPRKTIGYDPIPLPVGGVNYPIWTRTASEGIPISSYIGDPRGTLWLHAGMQVNASLNNLTAANAILVASRL